MLEVQNLVKTFDGETTKRRAQRRARRRRRRRAGLRRQRRQLRGRAGRAVHPARPVGLRQDHDAALDRRPGAARLGRRSRSGGNVLFAAGRGEQARERAGQRARPGHGVPVLRDLAAHDGVRQRRASRCRCGRAAQRPGKREIAERVDRVLETMELAAVRRPARRPSSPAASSSGWRWPGRSSSSRRCCCSTSRCPTWTPSCASRCASSSSGCSASSASPRSTSPTTRSRRWRCRRTSR